MENRPEENRKKDIEQQLSNMEARLKILQEQQTLWLQELVPALQHVHLELANIGQSLERLVKLFELQVAAYPLQQKEATKADRSWVQEKHLSLPTFIS